MEMDCWEFEFGVLVLVYVQHGRNARQRNGRIGRRKEAGRECGGWMGREEKEKEVLMVRLDERNGEDKKEMRCEPTKKGTFSLLVCPRLSVSFLSVNH